MGDPIALSYKLRDAGFEPEQVHALVEALSGVTETAVTKEALDHAVALLGSRTDMLRVELTAKIDRLQTETAAGIDRLQTETSARIDRLQTETAARIDRLQTETSARSDRSDLVFEAHRAEIRAGLATLAAAIARSETKLIVWMLGFALAIGGLAFGMGRLVHP